MQTPFTDKLHTNYVPLGPEIDQIRQVIAKPLDDIAKLNEQITRLQATINNLSRERDELSQFVEDHCALLSGVRRLPRELVQEIFLFCLPNKRNAVMSASEAPVLLGRICRSWRQISLSTPQLWSSLHIPIPDPNYLKEYGLGKLLQHGAVVKAWLERSGSLPLSLSLISTSRPDLLDDEGLLFSARYFLEMIVDFSERWRDVDLAIPMLVYEEYLSTLKNKDIPVLEKIRFDRLDLGPRDPLSAEVWQHGPIFLSPSLHHITLLSVDYPTFHLASHWERLTHLSLTTSGLRTALSSTKALEILNQCSKLISCKMDIHPEDLKPPPTIALPFLRSLEILEGLRFEGMENFFEPLFLPSLRHFKYSGTSFAQRDVSPPFKSIITQAQTPGIESFELGLTTVSRVRLISDCLPLLASLKRLVLSETPFYWNLPPRSLPILDNDILACLTPSDSGEYLCPRLEEIRLEGCWGISDNAIRPFLTARTTSMSLYPQMARLKLAKFDFGRKRNVNVFPELMPLMAEGLQVQLKYTRADPTDDWCSPWKGLREVGDDASA